MKECVLLGRGPTRTECPYDVNTEIWSVSWIWDIEPIPKRLDKLFTVHAWHEEDVEAFKSWQAKGCEIVAPVECDMLRVIRYPILEVLNEFNVKLFSDLICYMMAYAIYMKYERIWWFGVDCMGYSTYTCERGGMEFWAGVAKGRGIDVITTNDSATLKPLRGMYGKWGNRANGLHGVMQALPKYSFVAVPKEVAPVFGGER